MDKKTLAIVGGGLAGLAAAVDAVERGMRVELFEQSKSLGGRAGSFFDSQIGQWVDYCRHVGMGCCPNLLDFCRRTRIDDCFERSGKLLFIGPNGSQHDMTPSGWLPAPLHLLPGLARLTYLSARERWGIVGAMRRLTGGRRGKGEGGGDCISYGDVAGRAQAGPHPSALPKGEGTCRGVLPEGEGTVGEWLRRQGQSERAIDWFWSVVLVSALGETVDRASLDAARMVFREAFLSSRGASDLLLPRLPLRAIFHERVGKWLRERGVAVYTEMTVRRIEGDPRRARAVVLADGTRSEFDRAIVAVPWRSVRSLFADDLLAAMPALAGVEQIEPGAITAVHLWFDRPISTVRHAVLVGRLGQWVFVDRSDTGGPLAPQEYWQVVISASHRLAARKHDELLAAVRGELEAVWPEMRQATLVHARVVGQPAAVFSVQPGVDRFRPPQQTPIGNLALAGDWTATGWPATMEGAILSGNRAVEAIA
jgi:squalene-associated FAD-dependent desaturase